MAQDILELLTQDHDKARKLLDRLTSADEAAERRDVFQEIDEELRVHAKVEEEIFYPAVRENANDDETRSLIEESFEEHQEVESVLDELREVNASGEEFAELAERLQDLVEHHASEEEEDLFPKVREIIGKEDRAEIGEKVHARKEELQEKGLEALRAM